MVEATHRERLRRLLVGLALFGAACTPQASPVPPDSAARSTERPPATTAAPGGAQPTAAATTGAAITPIADIVRPTSEAAAATEPASLAAPGATQPPGTAEPARRWEVAWQHPLGLVTQGPRLGNGLVYAFIGNDVLALEAASGSVRWEYRAPRVEGEGAALGCPCASTTGDFTGKDVYVLAGANELRALDPTTGQARWAEPVGQAILTPTVSAESLVVVGGADEDGFALYGLDGASGAIRWQTPIDTRPVAWLALDGATVLAATSNRDLVAVEASSGHVRWTAPAPQGVALPFPDQVGRGGLLLAGDGTIRMLESATGAERWRAEVEGWAAQPLRADGRVYAATAAGEILALDERTGQRLWTRRTGGVLDGNSLALGEGVLYVPGFGNDLLAVDGATGQVRWKRTVGQVMSAPAVNQGLVWGGTVDGEMVGLRAATGEEVARVNIGETAVFTPVVEEGLVYTIADGRRGSTLVALRAQVD